MSGHSKWKNIMHKKEKTDSQRAKVFTKIGREIILAVKEGGAVPTPRRTRNSKTLSQKRKTTTFPTTISTAL